MNSALLALLGGAAVFVAVGFTVLGKPKPESSQSLPTTTEVSRSAPPTPPTHPSAELPARPGPTDAPLSPRERARLATAASEPATATAPATNAPAAAPMSAGKAAGKAAPISVPAQTFVPLQDPKRPSTPELEDLSQKILAWGESHQLANVATILANADHSDPLIRTYVAVALGKVAVSHTPAELAAVIAALGKLSQDKHPAVRNAAIKALSSIQAVAVLPYLEKSLGDAIGNTKQLASAAIARLKPLQS
jgi:HEAT repeats